MSLLNKRFETPYNTAPFSKIKTDHFLPAFVRAIKNEIGRAHV
jgi:peptidyl-dipeptidase Dcp